MCKSRGMADSLLCHCSGHLSGSNCQTHCWGAPRNETFWGALSFFHYCYCLLKITYINYLFVHRTGPYAKTHIILLRDNFLQKNNFNLFLSYSSDRYCKVFDIDLIPMERVVKVWWSAQVGTLFERSGAKTITSEPGKIKVRSTRLDGRSRYWLNPPLGRVRLCWVTGRKKQLENHSPLCWSPTCSPSTGPWWACRASVRVFSQTSACWTWLSRRLSLWTHNNNRNTSMEKHLLGRGFNIKSPSVFGGWNFYHHKTVLPRRLWEI